MANDYNEVAKQIISDTIRSVIFVDDDLAEPFVTESNPNEVKLSSGVYSSFRKNNCGLDLFKFKAGMDWEQSEEYFFKGRDLFIVDWQLDKDEPKYNSTLNILSKAVTRPNLHFICIYTAEDAKEFTDLIYKINGFFSPFNKNTVDTDLAQINKNIEEEGLDPKNVFTDSVLALFKELVLYRDKIQETVKSIQKAVTENGSAKLWNSIRELASNKENYRTPIFGYCAIGLALNKEDFNPTPLLYEVENFVDSNLVVVNHTLILFANKGDIDSTILYDRFSEAIINSSQNFLTLMGLEMRNLFKESSAFIGKDIDMINELAFFHHKEKTHPKDHFYDFLSELWRDQSSSFLHQASMQPKIFNSLDEYKTTHGIDEKVKEFIKNEAISTQQIAKLNYYYNRLSAKKNPKDKIGFGDIFAVNDAAGVFQNKYLLAITAHCDCLYTEKIEDNFYFVSGLRGNLKKAVDGGDTLFNSYITPDPKKNVVVVVDWRTKPFTLHIPPNANKINSRIPVRIGIKDFTLEYHSSLKESYAQRIANEAFSYPFRVGIFYADTKPPGMES